MLDYIPIYGNNGVRLRAESFHQETTTLLIPDHLKDSAGKIVQAFYGGKDFDVYFIQSYQEHFDLLDPLQKVINAIYMLTPIEKDIYYTNGRVLFGQNSTPVVEQKLHDYGFDEGTISLNKLSTDYEIIEDDLKLVMIGDGLMWIMVFIYCTTVLLGWRRCFLQTKKQTDSSTISGNYTDTPLTF